MRTNERQRHVLDRWQLVVAILGVLVAVVALANDRGLLDRRSAQPTTTAPDPGTTGPLNGDAGRSKQEYLVLAEGICEDRTAMSVISDISPPAGVPPDEYGRWLAGVAARNQDTFDRLSMLTVPTEDTLRLQEIMRLRRQANDLFLQTAELYKTSSDQAARKRSFAHASLTERLFHKNAEAYGFESCADRTVLQQSN
jgi:hypothetical protein